MIPTFSSKLQANHKLKFTYCFKYFLNNFYFLFFIISILFSLIYYTKDENERIFNLIKNEPNIKWKHIIENFSNLSLSYKHCENESGEFRCKCFTNRIYLDLEYWKNFQLNTQLLHSTKNDAIHYQIINNKLYRQKNCLFLPRCQGIEHFILKTLNKIKLKDMDLLINVHDWSQIFKYDKRNRFPILSFSKDFTQHNDIIYPAWSFWSGGPSINSHPNGIGKWDELKSKIIKCASKFDSKKDIAFFRGSRTSNERDAFILISRKNPDLIDAKYTKNQAWKSIQDTLGELPVNEITFEEHCKFKYLINMRGVAASFRYRHLFICRSLVLNVESKWIEFFYDALLPWYHYIPLEKNGKDLEDNLLFLKKYPDIAEQIAENGFQFISNYLTESSVQCYWNTLLLEYQKLINYKVEKEKDFLSIV